MAATLNCGWSNPSPSIWTCTMTSIRPSLQLAKYLVAILSRHLAVNGLSLVSALSVETSDVPGVADLHGHSHDLMPRPRLPELLQTVKARCNNVLVTRWRQGDAPAEPLLLLELQYIIKGVSLRVALVCEGKFGRGDVEGLEPLDITLHHRPLEQVAVDELPGDLFIVRSVGSCSEVNDLGIGESVEDPFPSSWRRCGAPRRRGMRSKKSSSKFESQRSALLASCWMLVSTMCDFSQSWIFASFAVENGNVGPGKHRLG